MGNSAAGNWIKRHFWVIFADVLGAAWLTSLLMTAQGAPALKPVLLSLLLLVPVTGLLIMLSPGRKTSTQPVPVPAVTRRRTVFIAPRPDDLRR